LLYLSAARIATPHPWLRPTRTKRLIMPLLPPPPANPRISQCQQQDRSQLLRHLLQVGPQAPGQAGLTVSAQQHAAATHPVIQQRHGHGLQSTARQHCAGKKLPVLVTETVVLRVPAQPVERRLSYQGRGITEDVAEHAGCNRGTQRHPVRPPVDVSRGGPVALEDMGRAGQDIDPGAIQHSNQGRYQPRGGDVIVIEKQQVLAAGFTGCMVACGTQVGILLPDNAPAALGKDRLEAGQVIDGGLLGTAVIDKDDFKVVVLLFVHGADGMGE